MKLCIGLSILFTYLLMVMGNIVTTTGSGLACPDWPLCHGSVIPPLELSIWFEWGHRLMGALTGMFVLISAILAWKWGRGPARWLTAASLGLLGLGVAFGGIIVIIEAPLLEGPLHLAVVSFHIILATIIFTMMILAFRRLPEPAGDGVSFVYPVLFGVVFVQVIIGILVRYGQATLACPDFPLCRGLIIPDMVDFKVTIHFIHRVMALLIFVTVAGYFIKAVQSGKDMVKSGVTFGLVIIQATLGVYVVWSEMFLPYIVAHGASGFFLLGWLAYQSAPCFVKAKPFEGAAA